jgi:hypothetical protein
VAAIRRRKPFGNAVLSIVTDATSSNLSRNIVSSSAEGRALAASHGREELVMAEIDPDVAHPVQIAASSHLRQELLRYNNS